MQVPFADLVAPGHTAIVTGECQGAVMGPDAGLALLTNEARRVALPDIERPRPAVPGYAWCTATITTTDELLQARAEATG